MYISRGSGTGGAIAGRVGGGGGSSKSEGESWSLKRIHEK